jgi:hypothetical protein
LLPEATKNAVIKTFKVKCNDCNLFSHYGGKGSKISVVIYSVFGESVFSSLSFAYHQFKEELKRRGTGNRTMCKWTIGNRLLVSHCFIFRTRIATERFSLSDSMSIQVAWVIS